MDLIGDVAFSAVSFSKRLLGIVTHPYQTYRTVLEQGNWGELVFLGLVSSCYFILASLVKTAAFHPILLTKQFVVLVGGAASGFLLMIILFASTGELLKKSIHFSIYQSLGGIHSSQPFYGSS